MIVTAYFDNEVNKPELNPHAVRAFMPSGTRA